MATSNTGIDPTTQTAQQMLQQTLNAWGLSSLSGELTGLLQQGYSSDTLSYALQNTPQYQQRFAANATRVQNGLPALSPAQYIALEEQYKQIGAQYGLPTGFFDTKADTDNLIANDVSATELDSRAQIASQQFQNADGATKNLWQNYYGLSAGAGVAAILNPETSLQTLQNESQAVQLGAAGAHAGLNVGAATATQLQQQNVSLSTAQSAFQSIAANLTNQNQITNRFGGSQTVDQTQQSMTNADLLNSGSDQAQLKTANAEETALFAGHAGADQTSLAQNENF